MDNDSITDVVRRGYSQKRTVSEYSKKMFGLRRNLSLINIL
jgi:hypothetical protein